MKFTTASIALLCHRHQHEACAVQVDSAKTGLGIGDCLIGGRLGISDYVVKPGSYRLTYRIRRSPIMDIMG